MNKEKDISIIEWHPLPAPKERFLLIRYRDEEGLCSEVAFSNDGTAFTGDTGYPIGFDIEAWAYLPYDVPTTPEDEEFEDWLRNTLQKIKKDKKTL